MALITERDANDIALVENVHRLRQAIRQMDRALNRGAPKTAAAT